MFIVYRSGCSLVYFYQYYAIIRSCISFSCCITNCHTHLLFYSFWGPGVQVWLHWVLCSGSHRLQSSICWAVFSPGRLTGEESISWLIQAVGMIHFLAFVWLRVLVPTGHLGPCHVASPSAGHIVAAGFFKASRNISHSGLLKWRRM